MLLSVLPVLMFLKPASRSMGAILVWLSTRTDHNAETITANWHQLQWRNRFGF